MDAQAMKDLVQQLAVVMNRGALDELDAIMADDFVRHCEATPDVVVESRDDFKAFLRAFAEGFPDNVQTLTHVVAADDQIGIFATYEGTHLGPFGPFPATGKRIDFSFAGVFRVENDKLAEFWVTWDNMTILGQLGLLPAS